MADHKNNDKDFVIDVAKERSYPEQSKEYSQAFSKWREKKDNPYAYNFVHDTREHSYVADEGYLNRKADVSERMALYKCLGLLGAVLLVMTGIDVIHAVILNLLEPEIDSTYVYYTDKSIGNINMPLSHIIILAVFDVLKYIMPAVIFVLITKIPREVAFPRVKNKANTVSFSVFIMLVILILVRICKYGTAKVFSLFHLDSIYIYMFQSTDTVVSIISVLVFCIIVPIVREIFLRGIVMQTFRQFGDGFALVLTSLISGFMFYDLSNIGYGICCGAVLGFFTLKTGSIFIPLMMSVLYSLLNYVLSILSLLDSYWGVIVEMGICLLILSCAIIVYSRITVNRKWNFNIESDKTEMTFGQKLRVILSTNTIAIWLSAVLVFTFMSVRVIK